MKEKTHFFFWVILSLAIHLVLLIRTPAPRTPTPPGSIYLLIQLVSGPASRTSATTAQAQPATTGVKRPSAISRPQTTPSKLDDPAKPRIQLATEDLLPDSTTLPDPPSLSPDQETRPETSPLPQPPDRPAVEGENAPNPLLTTSGSQEKDNPEEVPVSGPAGGPLPGGPSLDQTAPATSSVVTPLAYGTNPPPPYPVTARRRGWQGQVMLRIEVTADGKVRKAVVEKSSGFSILDNAARNAVYRWRFQPARRSGRPVPGQVLIPVRFDLRASD